MCRLVSLSYTQHVFSDVLITFLNVTSDLKQLNCETTFISVLLVQITVYTFVYQCFVMSSVMHTN